MSIAELKRELAKERAKLKKVEKARMLESQRRRLKKELFLARRPGLKRFGKYVKGVYEKLEKEYNKPRSKKRKMNRDYDDNVFSGINMELDF